MKRWWVVLAASIPLLVGANVREDYARQWTLALSVPDAGAYRVALDAAVYRTLVSPDLRDVDVVDARGQPVAADVFGPDAPLAAPPSRATVPWFALQAPRGGDGASLALIAQRDTTGRILSLQAQATRDGGPAEARAFLFDLSNVRGRIEAIELALRPDAQADSAFRVEASDDLQDWRVVSPRVQVLALQQAGQRLAQTVVKLDGTPTRYLRLVPLDAAPALPLTGALARIAAPPIEKSLQWEIVQGRANADGALAQFEFELVGRFPVERVDVRSLGNAAIEWRVESRDDAEAPWQVRAGPWIAYRVAGRGGATASAPVSVAGAPVRDRYWRLIAQSGRPTEPPALRLGYRPEVVVFLAQGQAPYALVAGSAEAQRAPAPLPRLVDAMRRERGEAWQPAHAILGPAVTLAGYAALVARMGPRDWKQLLLWGVLVLGAIVVAGFAFSLVRKAPAER